MQWHDYLQILTALIVLVDPLGIIPIFISITADETVAERRRTARVAIVSAAIVLIIATLVGHTVLRFFGIRLASFTVGGGILILLMAISMLNARMSPAKTTPEEARESEDKQNVAVVPLAVPLLAGPAAISTVIIYSQRTDTGSDWLLKGYVILCIVIVGLLTWGALRLSIPLSKRLGRTGLNNFTRIMGLLLAAIAVEFIVTGLQQLFPILAGP